MVLKIIYPLINLNLWYGGQGGLFNRNFLKILNFSSYFFKNFLNFVHNFYVFNFYSLKINFSFYSLKIIYKFFKNFFMLTNFINFQKFSFFKKFSYCISVGLGFRKKIRTYFKQRFLVMYMGTRHWLAFKIPKDLYIFPFKRGSLVFFSGSKFSLNNFLKNLQHVRRELVFKIKGFYIRRLKVNKKIGRTWAFARRVKFYRIKTKLSKKQKFI